MRRTRYNSGLTSRQEAFCRAFAEGGDPCSAYRHAYRCDRRKPETVDQKAAELLAEPTIAAAIWGLRGGRASRAAVTIDRLVHELDEARALALAKGHSAAAVSATLGKAKLYGLPIDRKAVLSANIESMPDDELEAYIRRLEAEIEAETRRLDGASPTGDSEQTGPARERPDGGEGDDSGDR